MWALFYGKEIFLAGLLSLVQQAGAGVLSETVDMGAEDASDGVKVRVRGKSGEQTLEARTAIAANGVSSLIVNQVRD